MSIAVIVVVIVVVLLVSMFLGAPVQAALGITALVGILFFMGSNHIVRFGAVAYVQSTSASQMVAPLFILMAEFLARGGVAEDIYDVISHGLRKVTGGLAIATTLASTVFAALCGSSVATAATLGKISIGSMIMKGYRSDFATGTVAAGGTLGIMIPPSMTFVLFGIITETSIAKLLIAGLLPGIMLSGLFCLSIIIRCRLNPSLYDGSELREGADESMDKIDIIQKAKEKEHAETLSKTKILYAIPAGVLILIVLLTLYSGVATPTESAGYGAVGALIIVVILRRLTFSLLKDTVASAVRTTCMMLFMAIMGLTLSYVISYLGIAQGLAEFIIGAGMNRWTVMIALFVLWLVLGCLMDPGSMVVLTMPFVFNTLVELGFDPIWIGVTAALMTEVGMITPPVGLNLFVLGNVTGLPLAKIIKGALPYVMVMFIGLVLLCVFPQIALFLPSHM
jgi:C4-dicarboxylate transporter DctM subunit